MDSLEGASSKEELQRRRLLLHDPDWHGLASATRTPPSGTYTNTPTHKHTNTDNGSLCRTSQKLKKRALSDIHPRQRCQPIRAGHRPPGGRRLGKTPLRLGLDAGPGESANYLRHWEPSPHEWRLAGSSDGTGDRSWRRSCRGEMLLDLRQNRAGHARDLPLVSGHE